MAGSGTLPAFSNSTPLVHEQGGVAAVVEDHVGTALAGPEQRLLGTPPVLLERLTLPGEDGDAGGGVGAAGRSDRDCCRRVILSREDVATGPAHPRAQCSERLDEDRRLDGHVQGAGDASAGQWLAGPKLGPHGHEAGHLVLGQVDLLASELGRGKVGHLVGNGVSHRHTPLGRMRGAKRHPVRWAGRRKRNARAPTSVGGLEPAQENRAWAGGGTTQELFSLLQAANPSTWINERSAVRWDVAAEREPFRVFEADVRKGDPNERQSIDS